MYIRSCCSSKRDARNPSSGQKKKGSARTRRQRFSRHMIRRTHRQTAHDLKRVQANQLWFLDVAVIRSGSVRLRVGGDKHTAQSSFVGLDRSRRASCSRIQQLRRERGPAAVACIHMITSRRGSFRKALPRLSDGRTRSRPVRLSPVGGGVLAVPTVYTDSRPVYESRENHGEPSSPPSHRTPFHPMPSPRGRDLLYFFDHADRSDRGVKLSSAAVGRDITPY